MEQIEYKNYIIKIHQDECIESPRDWDNLGIIVVEHRHYNIGDKDHDCIKDEINTLVSRYLLKDNKKLMQAYKVICESKSLRYLVDTFKNCNSHCIKDFITDYLYDADDYCILFQLLDLIDEVFYLPVYIYDHSGIRLNTSGFSCRWDSGQIGFIYVEKEKLIKEGLSDKSDSEVFEYLKQEIKTYSQYLEGDVYCFNIVDSDDETIYSCGGYYGYQYCLDQAKEAINNIKA